MEFSGLAGFGAKRPATDAATGDARPGAPVGQNKHQFLVGTGDHQTTATITNARIGIAHDRRLAALENHCFSEFHVPKAYDIAPDCKKFTTLYHQVCANAKGTGTKVGDAKNWVFCGLVNYIIEHLNTREDPQHQAAGKSLKEWIENFTLTENQVDATKVKNLARVVSQCEVKPAKNVTHINLGWKTTAPPEVKSAINRVLTEIGTEEHDIRAPLPPVRDMKDALRTMGEFGKGGGRGA